MEGVWLGERKALKTHGTGPFRNFVAGLVLADCGECGTGIVTTRPIAKGEVVWEADATQTICKVLTEAELLSLPAPVRDAWLEYAWSMSNGFFVGPRLDLPLDEAKMLDASCFLNHSSHPALGFSGDFNMVAIRDVEAGEMLTYDYCMSEWRVFGACEFKDTSIIVLDDEKKDKKKKKKKDGKKKDGKKKKGEKKKDKKGGNVDDGLVEKGGDDPRAPFSDFRETVSLDDYKLPELQKKYAGHFLSSVQRLIDLHHVAVGEDGFRELNKSIVLKDHPIKVIGKGLFAGADMKKGDLVWRTNGVECIFRKLSEITSADEATQGFYLHYGYQTDENEFSTPPSLEWLQSLSDVSSYMNHSCDPTVEIVDYDLWVTRRDVKAGEELTYDYAMSEVAFSRLPVCACGTALCRGKVTKDDYRLPQLRHRYLMSFSSHVLARIAAEPSFFP